MNREEQKMLESAIDVIEVCRFALSRKRLVSLNLKRAAQELHKELEKNKNEQ